MILGNKVEAVVESISSVTGAVGRQVHDSEETSTRTTKRRSELSALGKKSEKKKESKTSEEPPITSTNNHIIRLYCSTPGIYNTIKPVMMINILKILGYRKYMYACKYTKITITVTVSQTRNQFFSGIYLSLLSLSNSLITSVRTSAVTFPSHHRLVADCPIDCVLK